MRDPQTCASSPVENKIRFWDSTKRGANIFNVNISPEDISAAKAYGIQFVRLSLDKFPTKRRRDFLMKNGADNYTSLDPDDLAILKEILDIFERENMPVVITLLGLPGSRWNQLNGNKDDLRIWKNKKYQERAAKFWRDLADELLKYKIVVGYNILNEPHPERLFDSKSCHIKDVHQEEVQKLLNDFNELIVRNIRAVDPYTPIVIDSSAYADPNTFKNLRPIDDPFIIYSFHMYEPYEYTNHQSNKGKYSYPGKVAGKSWDKEVLREYMHDVRDFQKKYNIPSSRILVGEFGGYRRQQGLSEYFTDLIQIFEENGWHWAFYAFREDSWDGMDYELGAGVLPWEYWKAREHGTDYAGKLRRPTHHSFSVLLRGLCSE
jgi:aryl-phospho-beta-D-glucosidase BglC (GH1 family)